VKERSDHKTKATITSKTPAGHDKPHKEQLSEQQLDEISGGLAGSIAYDDESPKETIRRIP
jgi:hypothetical protein